MTATITAKRVTVAVGAAFGFLVVIGGGLSLAYSMVLNEREQKVAALTQVAAGIVEGFRRAEAGGKMGTEEAKAAAASALRDLRYGSGDYFFIYRSDGTVLLSPSRPEREGLNKIDDVDPDGVHFIRELIDASKEGGRAVTYRVPKVGGEVPLKKVSYSYYVKNWEWMLGTGVYVDDIGPDLERVAGKITAVAAGFLVVAILWARFLGRHRQPAK